MFISVYRDTSAVESNETFSVTPDHAKSLADLTSADAQVETLMQQSEMIRYPFSAPFESTVSFILKFDFTFFFYVWKPIFCLSACITLISY